MKITSLAVVLIALVILGPLNLGLITIAGAGTPRVRYQSEEVTTSPEPLAWGFDDLEEAALPPGAELLSSTQLGGWGVRRNLVRRASRMHSARPGWVSFRRSHSARRFWATW